MKLSILTVMLLSAGLLALQSEEPEAAGPEVGKPAPTARLNDHHGQATTLGGKRKGWTVVAFFPMAATPG